MQQGQSWIEQVGDRIYARGNTYKFREYFKILGGTYEPGSKSWYFPPYAGQELNALIQAGNAGTLPPIYDFETRLRSMGYAVRGAKGQVNYPGSPPVNYPGSPGVSPSAGGGLYAASGVQNAPPIPPYLPPYPQQPSYPPQPYPQQPPQPYPQQPPQPKRVNGVRVGTITYEDVPMLKVGDQVQLTTPAGVPHVGNVTVFNTDYSFVVILPDQSQVKVNMLNGKYTPEGDYTIAFSQS